MATIRRVEEIQAWKKARELVREICGQCAEGALAKDFGFRDQLRRAGVSSMSNIAEGFARKSDREFAHSLDIAKGSAIEVQSLTYVALDVHYIGAPVFDRLSRLADEAASLVAGLTTYLRGITRRAVIGNRTPPAGPMRPTLESELRIPDREFKTPASRL